MDLQKEPPWMTFFDFFRSTQSTLLINYCKSTIFGRYKIWRLGKSGPIWRTLICRFKDHPKNTFPLLLNSI